MSPEQNTEAPDPHAAYRRDVEQVEDAALTGAMLTHFRQRSYGLALEVRARDARILDLENRLAAALRKVDEAFAHTCPGVDTPDQTTGEGEGGSAGLDPGTSGHTAD